MNPQNLRTLRAIQDDMRPVTSIVRPGGYARPAGDPLADMIASVTTPGALEVTAAFISPPVAIYMSSKMLTGLQDAGAAVTEQATKDVVDAAVAKRAGITAAWAGMALVFGLASAIDSWRKDKSVGGAVAWGLLGAAGGVPVLGARVTEDVIKRRG